MEAIAIFNASVARALYEKMGFRIGGVKPDAIRLKNGKQGGSFRRGGIHIDELISTRLSLGL